MRLLHVLLVLVVIVTAGCTYERVISDDTDQWRRFATREYVDANPTSPDYSPEKMNGWAIELAAFAGTRRQAASQRMMSYLTSTTLFKDAWILEGNEETFVMLGKFSYAEDPDALELLHKVRTAEIDSVTQFEKADIVPLGKAIENAVTAMDLAQFTGKDGYTLQVAYFDKNAGPHFREAAEAYCRQLREQKEQAYYYHTPQNSMVTVGLFTDDDWTGEGIQRGYGPSIRELQQRFPYNVVNGATLREKLNGTDLGEQPSVMVHLPR